MSPSLKDRNMKAIRPYGDTYDDGVVQLSFSLPLPVGDRAMEAARRLVLGMGFEECEVVFDKDLGEDYSYFVAYAKTATSINYDEISVPKVDVDTYGREECSQLVEQRLGRDVVVVGACTGSDAHTVGIDAILNMKGFDGHYGLERYRMFETHNLGSQVKNEDLIKFAIEHKADAILISQVVTQKETHIHNLTEFIELARKLRHPRPHAADYRRPPSEPPACLELGFDAGFGRKKLCGTCGLLYR